MPLDGSGNFTRARDWTTDDGNALNIEASLFDEHDDDMATAFNTAFYRDGQASATGTFTMNANKIDLDADADTSITADTDDQIDFELGAADIHIMTTVASGVNGFDLAGSATGDAAQLKAQGTDTNIDLDLVPKGTGVVNIGGVAQPTVLPGYIAGLLPSQDTDTDHDINITAGIAAESSDGHYIELASEITKRLDATWAVGDDQGGLFTGTIAADTWYHLFVIRRSDTGVVDAGFDTSFTAANIPTNYDSYRRILTVRTEPGSDNLLDFSSYLMTGGAVELHWGVGQQDTNEIPNSSSRQTETLASVPPGKDFLGRFTVHLNDVTADTGAYFLMTEIGQADTTPTASQHHAHSGTETDSGSRIDVTNIDFWSDSSAQLHYRLSTALADLRVRILVHGFIDHR